MSGVDVVSVADGKTKIVGLDGQTAVGVDDQNRMKVGVTLLADVVGIGNQYGWDNSPWAYVTVDPDYDTGDQGIITIGTEDCSYTVLEGDSYSDVMAGLANSINTNANVKDSWLATIYFDKIHIRSKVQGDQTDDISVVATGTLELTASSDKLDRVWKPIMVEVDPYDKRYGRIGVFGEIGVLRRANNPIHISEVKNIATASEVVFTDKTIPIQTVWYITNVLVADDISTKFTMYSGIQRDKIEEYIADGETTHFPLDNNSVNSSNYITVTVDSVEKTLGSDYSIADYVAGRSQIVFPANKKPVNNAVVEITYDAAKRILALFVQANSSQDFEWGAPIKLDGDNGEFIIASVTNKSANEGEAIANINGFFEPKFI